MIVHNLTFLQKLSKNFNSIVIIGKGKESNKYIFDENKIIILTINDSIFNYKNYSHCTCIVEGHLNKNLPLVMNKIKNVIIIKKNNIKELELVVGCTPSIVISYLIRCTEFKNIFLQGFSMDGEIILNDPIISEKIHQIYKDSIIIYNKNKNAKEAFEYFQYNSTEFIGQINHYPYDWTRQVAAFEECFKMLLNEQYNKELNFITECTRKSKYFRFKEIEYFEKYLK